MDKVHHLFLLSTHKLLAGLLTLLGFSLAACDKMGPCEYITMKQASKNKE